jgi:hypothetical protein
MITYVFLIVTKLILAKAGPDLVDFVVFFHVEFLLPIQ